MEYCLWVCKFLQEERINGESVSRRFSWNQCAEEQLGDWHTFKMVLTDHFKSKGSVPNEEEKSNETNDREMLASESKRKNNESKNW